MQSNRPSAPECCGTIDYSRMCHHVKRDTAMRFDKRSRICDTVTGAAITVGGFVSSLMKGGGSIYEGKTHERSLSSVRLYGDPFVDHALHIAHICKVTAPRARVDGYFVT